jgi:hypothetical protein
MGASSGGRFQVNHITRVARPQDAGAHHRQAVVKPVQVPVGVFDLEGFRRIAALQVSRDLGAYVRHADQQRHAALLQGKNFACIAEVTHGVWPLKN